MMDALVQKSIKQKNNLVHIIARSSTTVTRCCWGWDTNIIVIII